MEGGDGVPRGGCGGEVAWEDDGTIGILRVAMRRCVHPPGGDGGKGGGLDARGADHAGEGRGGDVLADYVVSRENVPRCSCGSWPTAPPWDAAAAGREVPGAYPGCIAPGADLAECNGLRVASRCSFQNEWSAAEKLRRRGAAGPAVHEVAAAWDGISWAAIVPPRRVASRRQRCDG